MQRLVGDDGEHAVIYDLAETALADFGQAAQQNLRTESGPTQQAQAQRGQARQGQVQLLLTHGNGLNSGMWAAVTPHLLSDFHCWGLDFRGHGLARETSPGIDVERPVLAAEITAAVEYLRSLDQPATTGGEASSDSASSRANDENQPAPIVGVGHSLGAACMLMAEIANPGTFSALWLYEPVLFPLDVVRPEAPSPLIEAARRRRIHFDSTQAALDRFISKPPFLDCEPAAVRAYVELGTYPASGNGNGGGNNGRNSSGNVDGKNNGVVLSCSGITEAKGYEAIKPLDFGLLSTVLCPTVVARGGAPAEYNEYPPEIAEPISAELPNARLETFDKLSHFGPMEDGAGAAASIRSFLSSHFG